MKLFGYNIVECYDFGDKIWAKADEVLPDGRPVVVYVEKREGNKAYEDTMTAVNSGQMVLKAKETYEYHWLEGRLHSYAGPCKQIELLYDKIKEHGTLAGIEAWVALVDDIKTNHPKT